MKHTHSHQAAHVALLEPHRSDIERCVKCGSCRAVCPAFRQGQEESQSARGRIALVQAVLDGRLNVSTIFRDRLATCAGCLACEAACPSSVPVMKILQAAKELAMAESGLGIVHRIISSVFKHPAAFRTTAWLVPLLLHYDDGQRCEGTKKGNHSKLRNHRSLESIGGFPGREGARGNVVFFPGCAINSFQQDIGRAVISILSRLGYHVRIPKGLRCCGRPLLSLGDRQAAKELASRNVSIISAIKADAVVTACASCGLTFKKEYLTLLRPGEKMPAVVDIHEFLAGHLSLVSLRRIEKKVTYHDPCHLSRGQGLSGEARKILRSIPGLVFEEMHDADRCCGFGGVMRMTHYALSDGIAAEKARNVIATGASAVVTGCPSCCMQISHALKVAGSQIVVFHTAQVLRDALPEEP